MDRLGFWNIRGLNRPNKQSEVKYFLSQNKLSVFGLLETKIAASSVSRVSSLFSSYSICTNSSIHKGGRVWLLWDPSVVDIDIKLLDAQCIVAEVKDKVYNRALQLSMVYAFNKIHERKRLWDILVQFSSYSGPWIACGDFNNVLNTNERLGAEVSAQELGPFIDCVRQCGLNDMSTQGAFFTWNNKQLGPTRACSRIDRVLINDSSLLDYPLAYAHFLPEGLFDHCPCVIHLVMQDSTRKSRFRYFNMWSLAPNFLELVQEGWNCEVVGTLMYRVVSKLKGLKLRLKGLNKGAFSNIEGSAEIANKALHDMQIQMQLKPTDVSLEDVEKQLRASACLLGQARDAFLRQKAKVRWADKGDCNSSFFHSQIRARRMQNRVLVIQDINGIEHDTQENIQMAFADYFQSILGCSKQVQPVHRGTVQLGPLVREEVWPSLLMVPPNEEIREAMFGIQDDKASGPDGFTSKFFKDTWLIVGKDICLAIKDFFKTGKLLKQINTTILTLIPKVSSPKSVAEFRPIACCNTISKCISKLLCNRMSLVLPEIISPNQSAFIKGRQIVENVLICQDLVKLYTRKHCSPRCLLKIDLRKAYDSVEWSFVEEMLVALHFASHFISLIMSTVRSPWYSISINGDCFGFFKGERGLRQWDPLSPLLFTVCMEYLSRILLVVARNPDFHFHPLCGRIGLNHMCFADDLLLFSKGDTSSVRLLLRGFLTFSKASGLEMNASKSSLYCNGVSQQALNTILRFSGFVRGQLPFKYLGVSISSKRLSTRECFVLSERICAKIRSWGARKLSYTGRLVLVKAVLNSLHSYWASIFLLPLTVMKRVIALCRNYLWAGCEEYHRAPPIAWDTICLAKVEGGLGIIHCIKWNIAALGKYVWWIANKKDHLWVRWVSAIYLKDTPWMEYEPSPTSSWAWRQLCKVRDTLRTGYTGDQWSDKSGSYSIQSGYKWLTGSHPKVSWAHSVWSRFNVPRWSFVAWLMRHQRLLTLDRVAKFGILTDGLCFLCGAYKETNLHLFFGCVYSKLCLIELQVWLGLKMDNGRWQRLRRGSRFTSFQIAVSSAINGLIYHIWFQRNVCRLEVSLLRPLVVFKQVRRSLLLRLNTLDFALLSRKDRAWLEQLRR